MCTIDLTTRKFYVDRTLNGMFTVYRVNQYSGTPFLNLLLKMSKFRFLTRNYSLGGNEGGILKSIIY